MRKHMYEHDKCLILIQLYIFHGTCNKIWFFKNSFLFCVVFFESDIFVSYIIINLKTSNNDRTF